MGAYLSTPAVEKKSDNYEDSERFSCGVSGMQGWRISMEDAHNCVLDLEKGTSLFGVYDGHGGSEVAIYCSLHFAEVLKEMEAYKRGDYKSALEDAFMKIDRVLTEPGTIRELKVLANKDPGDGPPTEADYQEKDAEEEYEEDETKLLYEEATMSIEELLARYGKAANDTKAAIEKLKESSNDDEQPSDVKEEAGGSAKSSEPEAEPASSSSSSSQTTKRMTATSAKASTSDETSPSPSNGAITQSEDQSAGSSSSAKEPPNGPLSSASEVGKAEATETVKEESTEDSDESASKVKKVNMKVKPQPKITSKVQPKIKPLQALLDDEEIEDDEDSDSEEGFDSDEAVEGSSDSEQDTTEEEEEDEDDEPNVLEVPNPTTVEEPGKDSGSTAVVALLRGRDLYVANAGDSRCVLSRKGKALDMSEDHKPEDETEMRRIKAAGGHVNFQGRVNGGLNLSRAIGDHCYKMNTELELHDQMISAMPDVRKIRLRPGDEFMVLACDGIWNVFSSQEVVDFMQVRIPTMDEKSDYKLSCVCEELFDICLAPDTMGDGTGCDNMTCIIVRFNQEWLEKCEAEDPTPPDEELELESATDSEKTQEITYDEFDEKDSQNSKITEDGEAKEDAVDEAVAERNSNNFTEPNCGDNQQSETKTSVKACKRPRTDDNCEQNADSDILTGDAEESKRPRVA